MSHQQHLQPGDRVIYEQSNKRIVGVLIEIRGRRCIVEDSDGVIHDVSIFQTGYLPDAGDLQRRIAAVRDGWTDDEREAAYWRARSNMKRDGRGAHVAGGLQRPGEYEIPIIDTGLLPEGGREWL